MEDIEPVAITTKAVNLMEVRFLLSCEKHMFERIISIRGEIWTQQNQFNFAICHLGIPSQDSDYVFVCRDRPFNLQRGGAMFFFFAQKYFLGQHELEYFFLSCKVRNFFPEFNIRLYDKNSESDFIFSLHQNQNIFSATLGIRIFLQKN